MPPILIEGGDMRVAMPVSWTLLLVAGLVVAPPARAEGEEFHFLPKPFSLKQLAVAVKETLGR